MKVYFGVRNSQGCQVFWWDSEDPARPQKLPMALEVWNHSPDGAEWGYGGSGPAQLALALLYHATGDKDFSVALHQPLKRAMVAGFPRNIWARTEEDVLLCAYTVAMDPAHEALAAQYLRVIRSANKKKGPSSDA